MHHLFVWLINAPYGSGARRLRAPRAAVASFADIWSTMRVMAHSQELLSMTVLIGAASFFVGNAYQAQMPEFARDLGHGRADFSYSMLLAADAAGGLAGGVLLETRGLLQPRARTAYILAMIWCCALIGFARANMLCGGAYTVVCGGIFGTRVQFDGAGIGADSRAGRDSRTCDRRVFDVGHGNAYVQWTVSRLARRKSRDSQFVGIERNRAVGSVRGFVRRAPNAVELIRGRRRNTH